MLFSLIVIVPLLGVIGLAFYCRRYVRDIADYLASGRVAGRYVISVGDLTAGLSVITLVALCEQNYQCGMAMSFWAAINTPLALFISLTGYCIYRFRQTRCLSIGQFFELRYSRPFRIVAAFIRTMAEMVTNAIGPAVAVRFFIYFLGIPHKIPIFGFEIPTYGILVALLLVMALAIIWPAGRISLLVTDCIQGIVSYPIFVIITVFILTSISWFDDVAPVMLDRAAGESFLNPMDIDGLRDFNVFALIVTVASTILNRAAWIGNDTTNAGRTPHEQKMAGILGTWRNGFAFTMMTLIGIFVITFMLHGRFAPRAHEVRVTLAHEIASEVFERPEVRNAIRTNVAGLPVPRHEIGMDAPYSQKNNPDAAILDTALKTIQDSGVENANGKFQEFRSLYNQMMMPVMLRSVFPPVLVAIFSLLMLMLLLSTDDGRIFNASSTLIQDVILPFRKKPISIREQLLLLKLCSLAVTVFFFIVSLFFAQLDYINMFVTIMCAVWLGAAGPIMVGGLYTRW
ncbi:MAG: sodium:panthothenate symporter, partial [Victivallaceae bacterium]